MTTLYAVRLTCSYNALWDTEGDELESFIQYCNERFDDVIIYEHVGTVNENVHCHLLLRGDSQSPSTDAIRKSLPFKHLNLGSREHSFKSKFKDKRTNVVFQMTDESVPKYITYMSKGCIAPEYVMSEKWDLKTCLKLAEEWKAPPQSKTAVKVAAFERYLGDERAPIPTIGNINPEYGWLKNKVWSYVMNKYDGFDYQAASDFKMLLVTFMYKRGIVADKESKHYI